MSEHHYYHNSSSGPGFSGGVLLGALLGAGIVLLLGTKRGKELAEELKEKGLSLVDDFDALLNELDEDVVEQPPQPVLNAGSAQETAQSNPPTGNEHSDVQTTNNLSTVKIEASQVPSHIETLQAQGRRLFHGIPKRR